MDQPFSLAYGQGVNTKTDSKQVIPGKLLRLENAIFTDEKRINKRNGHDLIPTTIDTGGNPSIDLASIKATKAFKEQLVVAADRSLYTYGESTQQWFNKGPYQSLSSKETSVFQPSPGNSQTYTAIAYQAVSCIFQNLYCEAWTEPNSGGGGGSNVQIKFIDMETGAIVPITIATVHQSFAATLLSWPKLVATNAGPALLYINASHHLILVQYGYSTGPSGPTISSTVYDLTTTSGAGNVQVPTSIGLQLAPEITIGCLSTLDAKVNSSGVLVVAYIPDASGQVVTLLCTNPAAPVVNVAYNGNNPHSVSLQMGGDDKLWVYNTEGTTGSGKTEGDLYLTILPSNNTGVFGATNAIAVLGTGAIVVSLTAYNTAALNQAVIYSLLNKNGVAEYWTSDLWHRFVNGTTFAAGTLPTSRGHLILTNFWLHSEAFLVNSRANIAVNNVVSGPYYTGSPVSNTQSTLWVIDITDAAGTLASSSTISAVNGAIAKAFVDKCVEIRAGNLSAASYISSTKVNLPSTSISSLLAVDATSTLQPVIQILGVGFVTLDWDDPEAYQAISIDSHGQVWNGSIVTHYDGDEAQELGFNLAPESLGIGAISKGSDPGLTGVYQYVAVYSWIDNLGNIYRSAPSIPQSADFTDTGAAVVWSWLGLTAKTFLTDFNSGAIIANSVQIEVYRTTASGTTFYLLGTTINHVLGLPTTPPFVLDYLGFSDTGTVTDAILINSNQLYTNGGVLDNFPPDPSMAIATHNNRVWAGNLNTNILEYSQTLSPGLGIQMNPNLAEQISPQFGDIISLASMDDKMVVLGSRQPCYVSGDGANAVGSGSSLSNPQQIPSDTGCSSSRITISTPMGVTFRSPKGIYEITRSLEVKYFGSVVEQYNNQFFTSAVYSHDKNQLRLLSSTGLNLLYDYFFDQWSTFTSPTGLSADIWQDVYTYVTTSNTILTENSTSFLDDTDAFAVKAQTAWIKGGIIQGFQRIKEFLHLGDYANGSDPLHGVQVSIAYDYLANPDLPSFTDPVPFYFGDASTNGAFQYRQFLEQQKCESATFLIEELPTGASGENFNLTDMTILAGVKKGAFKLPSAQTAV